MADVKSEKEQLSTLENLFQQKRFSDALEVAKKASSDYPNSYPIKFLYVRTLKELNKLAEAGEVLRELMLIYPNNINLLLESGNLAVLQNKFDEGNEYYNKILFLDPFNTEAKNSIEEINIIKKNGIVRKGKGDFLSHQNEKLQSADTLPEFDSRKLRDIISEEPPPPPPPPPVPESLPSPPPPISEVDTDETEAARLFQEKIQEQEMDSPPGMESENPETPPIPEFEIPPLPEVEKEVEEIGEYTQKENREPPTGETAEPLPIPETDPWEKIQEQEPEEKMEEAEEPGFVTESAAELYVEQGLLKDAAAIYEKLYDSGKEERFLSKIEELKRVLVNQKKIQVLNKLLEHIRHKGEKIV
jgi:tetratricopeptide (TPR) repeat protein